jgi:hypothetical protein
LLAGLIHACFLLGLLFSREDGGEISPKCRLTFSGLQSIVYQKIELLITTTVRIAYPAKHDMFEAELIKPVLLLHRFI